MSSFSSLGIGVSALAASQRAVEVAAHNVANAGTEGYTRQRLAIQTALPTPGSAGLRGDGMRGMGVTVVGIDRLRDQLADVSWRSEAGVQGAAYARSEALSRTESVLGPYAEGAPQALSRFQAAWDALSLNPTDGAARSTVLATGAGLADSLRSSAVGLRTVSDEVTSRTKAQVGELNGLLTQVASLNDAILRAETGQSDPNDLRDQRDQALDRITALSGARVEVDDAGRSEVHLGDTALLTATTTEQLELTGEGASSTLSTRSGTPLTPSGQVGGYLSVVKSDLPMFATRLDALAVALRDGVNAIHTASTDLEGQPGREFFVGTGAADLALAPLSTSQVAAGRSARRADGEGALAMGALRTDPALDGQPIGAALRSFAARVGQAVTDSARSASTAKAGLQAAALTRASTNGVNIDEEMVDLVKYQHAYNAASRVITIVDEMLDKIINGMGR